jgi:hypothetical protein
LSLIQVNSRTVRFQANSREDIPEIIRSVSSRGGNIISCVPVKESLLEIYSRRAGKKA